MPLRTGGSQLESPEGFLGVGGHTIRGAGNSIRCEHPYFFSLSLSLSTTVSMAQPLIRFQYVHLLALHFSCVDTSWLPVGIFGRCSISIASATATASLSLCISLSIYLSYDVISPCRHTSFHHHVTLPCCQAKENLGAAGWSLSPAEVETLDRAAAKVPKQLIQNSFQTK